MKMYFLDHFASRKIYHGFISYIGAFSDAFSLVYFLYNRNEKPSKTVRRIDKALRPYEICSREVLRWPGTETKNANGHIYRLKVYQPTFDSLEALEIVDSLWDWNYPNYPMDLCFYRNGYAWFASSVHEHWNALYTDDLANINDLASVGLSVTLCGTVDINALFYKNDILYPSYSCDTK